MKKVHLTSLVFPLLLLLFLPWLIFKVWEKVTDNWQSFLAEPVQGEKQVGFNRFLSDPCAHGVRSLGRPVTPYKTFLKPCEDLVKTVNVVNVVKI